MDLTTGKPALKHFVNAVVPKLVPAKEFFMRISVSRHSEYCVFRRQNSSCWYAKFWDYEKSAWACRRSTGVPLGNPKATAEKAARQLLTAGVLTERDTSDSGFI
ncbi:hypothetical protein, partial [Treponema endosymbiont of Eucomonympha sp.]|uniref:hypothetical protein n=1 Tax=Treponema endosymbiont of Eucomonympha sp. TaxID=1580831 RepID=UPI00139683EC